MKQKAIRHGDLGLFVIEKFPEKLPKQSKSKVIMNGTNGHDHSYSNGKLYLIENKRDADFVIGYFEALENCKLFHPEHGVEVKGKSVKECSIPVGFYELRVQHEDTNEGMKQVID